MTFIMQTGALDDFISALDEFRDSLTDTEILDVIEAGTDLFVADAKRLPKPMSKIQGGRYTHLVNSINSRRNRKRNEIEVGWGKYYGPFLERGTSKMAAQPHAGPQWNLAQETYVQAMAERLFERHKL